MSGGVRGLGFSLLVIVIAVIAYLVVTAKKPAHKDGGGVATTAERLQEVKNPARI